MNFTYKTTPWRHQQEVLDATWDSRYKALFMEQRTGKSKVFIDTGARLFCAGKINAVLVIAPNDVHAEWVTDFYPTHCSVPYRAMYWRSGSITFTRKFSGWRCRDRDEYLVVRTINYEALLSPRTFKLVQQFIREKRVLLGIDESHRIKNPRAACTKAVEKIADGCEYRRILTGTPWGNEPLDLLPQMNVLHKSIIGISSATAFKAKYAELRDPNTDYELQGIIKKSPRARFAQFIKKDEQGRPIWKNLADLQRRIAPHAVVVKRADCADIPAKLYLPLTYELHPQQRVLYEQVLHTIDKTMPRIARLNVATAALQVMSNIMPKAYTELGIVLPKENPRLERLLQFLEDTPGQVVIWCQYIEEMLQIKERLNCALVYGATPKSERAIIRRQFMEGHVQYLVGHPVVGGAGFDLSAADTMVFYSNNFSYLQRAQAEDRIQHLSKARQTAYYDLSGRDSIDQVIINALINKEEPAEALLAALNK